MDKNQKSFVSVKSLHHLYVKNGKKKKKVRKPKTKFTILQIPYLFFLFFFFFGGGVSKIFEVPLFKIICGLSRNLGLEQLLLDMYLGKLSFV